MAQPKSLGSRTKKKASLARHVAFSAADPDRLAEFYRFALDMKTVGRLDSKDTGTTAVYLSDGNMNMALVKNSPIAKRGVQLLGIIVPSIKDVGETSATVHRISLSRRGSDRIAGTAGEQSV